jgi:succinate dehydrogenase / fumarate reductase cytochrome b subunit
VYVALVVAFCYHLVAGLRHLVWDTGHALERAQSQRSAWVVIAVTVVLVLLMVYRLWFAGRHAL